MPKAKKKKNSSFQTTITKSVFLYGRPNKEKLVILQQMQNSYTALINRDIDLLEKNPDIVLQLVKNDKKDPQMRKLEKAIRPEGINSAFCQNCRDSRKKGRAYRIKDPHSAIPPHNSILSEPLQSSYSFRRYPAGHTVFKILGFFLSSPIPSFLILSMDSVLAVTIKIEISICSCISRQISYPLLPGSIKSGKTHSYSTTFCDKCNITG